MQDRSGRTGVGLGRLVVCGLLLGIVVLGAAMQPSPAVATAPRALIKMPFTGYWDRFGLSHPSVHHTSGDWATDLYAAPGTWVRARFGAPAGTTVRLRVAAVFPTCSVAGGTTVKLDVYADGFRVGSVAYAHLDRVPATIRTGNWIGVGSRLGTLRMWRYQAGCWEVSNSAGVHVHLAAHNYSGYACYRPLKSGSTYPAGTRIGKVGSNGATGPRQACG